MKRCYWTMTFLWFNMGYWQDKPRLAKWAWPLAPLIDRHQVIDKGYVPSGTLKRTPPPPPSITPSRPDEVQKGGRPPSVVQGCPACLDLTPGRVHMHSAWEVETMQGAHIMVGDKVAKVTVNKQRALGWRVLDRILFPGGVPPACDGTCKCHELPWLLRCYRCLGCGVK